MHSLLRLAFMLPVSLLLLGQDQAPGPLGIGLEGYPYPWPVQLLPLTIEGQDLRMAYMDISPSAASNGATVILLHGKNFGGYYWEDTARALAAAGYRVIVPDQVGWGKSSKPDLHYSFQLLAANTAQLLDRLGIRSTAVLGHSTGGMLAVRFALMYPERVTRLILEDPIGLTDYRVSIPPQSDVALYRAEMANTDPDRIRAFYARYFAEPKPEVYGPLAEVQIRVTGSAEYPRWARVSALAYQLIYQQPVRYEYRLLQPPTLLVVGDKDHAVPLGNYASAEARQAMGNFVELGRAAVREIPHARLMVIPGCGHIPHIEKRAEFEAALVEFLRTGR